MRKRLICGAVLSMAAAATSADAAVIGYFVPSNLIGTQAYSSLGLDFNVNGAGIIVTDLGIYNDDDNNGAPGGD